MNQLTRIPIAQLAIVVGIVTAISWIVLPTSVALVVSIVASGLVALRATAGSATPPSD